MHFVIGNHITSVSDECYQKNTGDLSGQEEGGCDGTKEPEKAVHCHVDEEQDDKVCEEASSSQIKTHHKVGTYFEE